MLTRLRCSVLQVVLASASTLAARTQHTQRPPLSEEVLTRSSQLPLRPLQWGLQAVLPRARYMSLPRTRLHAVKMPLNRQTFWQYRTSHRVLPIHTLYAPCRPLDTDASITIVLKTSYELHSSVVIPDFGSPHPTPRSSVRSLTPVTLPKPVLILSILCSCFYS